MTKLYLLHAITSLHAGTGQGADIIDLPIARERSTGRPYVPGSSVKGVLAANCQDNTKQKLIYGPRGNKAGEHAGSVRLSDARLLLFPVRSLRGTFAWTTSPDILRRLVRDDFESAGLTPPAAVPALNEYQHALAGEALVDNNKVYLEDLDLEVQAATEDFRKWAQWLGEALFPGDPVWPGEFQKRFCLLHEDVFNFLHNSASEVRARIVLESETKTVKKGGLWYEESLPPETVLCGLLDVCPTPNAKSKLEENGIDILTEVGAHTAQPIQVGGKATVGRGLCRIRLHPGGGGQ